MWRSLKKNIGYKATECRLKIFIEDSSILPTDIFKCNIGRAEKETWNGYEIGASFCMTPHWGFHYWNVLDNSFNREVTFFQFNHYQPIKKGSFEMTVLDITTDEFYYFIFGYNYY